MNMKKARKPKDLKRLLIDIKQEARKIKPGRTPRKPAPFKRPLKRGVSYEKAE